MNTEPDDDDTDDWPRLSFEDIEAKQRTKELGYGQYQSLGLKPWQLPTCDFFYGRDEIDELLAAGPEPGSPFRKYEWAHLAKTLLDEGLSLFEPDPERALNNPDYRAEIKERVRKVKAASKATLSDEVIEIVIRSTPFSLSEDECAEFRRLLHEQPVRNFDVCAKLMCVVWKKHVARTRVYDEAGNRIR